MHRILPAAAAALAFAMAPAHADLASMTDAERAAFRGEVRDYLIGNPEVLMEALAALERRQAEAQSATDSDLVLANADALFRDDAAWVGGNPDGDVTVVEFMDYRCGYCRQAQPEIEALLAADPDIRFVLKEFPILGEASLLASRFAIATRLVAGDDAYKALHDALYEMRAEITPEALEDLAAGLDLDADAIEARLTDPEIDRIIAENHALAQRLQISGTPTFVVGDQMVRGYVPLEGMQQAVTAARAD